MSTSEKQLLANRANARKSTGPRTSRGKARSSQNAITHGLRAFRPVVTSPHLDESPEEYDALLSALRDELRPRGAFQNHLVVKIANSLWRAQRAVELETVHLENYYQDSDRAAATFPAFFRLVTGDDYKSTRPRTMPVPKPNRNLLYYEMRLDRQLTRSYALLRHLQAMEQVDSSVGRNPCGSDNADSHTCDNLGRPRLAVGTDTQRTSPKLVETVSPHLGGPPLMVGSPDGYPTSPEVGSSSGYPTSPEVGSQVNHQPQIDTDPANEPAPSPCHSRPPLRHSRAGENPSSQSTKHLPDTSCDHSTSPDTTSSCPNSLPNHNQSDQFLTNEPISTRTNTTQKAKPP